MSGALQFACSLAFWVIVVAALSEWDKRRRRRRQVEAAGAMARATVEAWKASEAFGRSVRMVKDERSPEEMGALLQSVPADGRDLRNVACPGYQGPNPDSC